MKNLVKSRHASKIFAPQHKQHSCSVRTCVFAGFIILKNLVHVAHNMQIKGIQKPIPSYTRKEWAASAISLRPQKKVYRVLKDRIQTNNMFLHIINHATLVVKMSKHNTIDMNLFLLLQSHG